ncbi:hypothetical protein [Tenacibaculum jejuense]|uniref:Uncharacterized protein n=1 Tax=Tenacibaculum jejuense TaxID=584609 RepID=A0A238U6T9_9FLAO|nr:hypothetical protein [Tenacibaculum jejuense]SNR14726.1 protein of unknown function [Tenacibaculum jejuense]
MDIKLKPLSSHYPHYRRVKEIVLEEAYRRIDLPVSERIELFYRNMDIQFDNFKKKIRPKEYSKVRLFRSKYHSCTSAVPGRVKDCGWKCIPKPPGPLIPYNIKVAGDNKGTKSKNGTVCLKMTVAGKGKNKGTISATFKYPPYGKHIRIGGIRMINPYFRTMKSLFEFDTTTLKNEIMNNETVLKEVQKLIHTDNKLNKRF